MPPRQKGGKNAGTKQLAKKSALLLSAAANQTSFSSDLLLQLLQVHQPACNIYSTTHTNRKDNPNCFCALIPKPGSSKKKGLWQKEPSILSALGSDPNAIRRSDAATPCGLANLGNTCYVNSALQCLFMIPEFRQALYQIEEPSSPIVTELRQLFVQLEWGLRQYVDPAAFARSLNLETNVQQDGQEFMKLLLSKLESLFRQSQHKAVREVVPALFKGAYRFVTECKTCGKESQSSANLIDFYELPLQVQNYSSVAESLSAFLSAELLEGDNQYYCEMCSRMVDASRQTVLQQLPPCLCLALQRFMFNFETMNKQKAMDKLSFPLTLDLTPFVPASRCAGAADSGDGSSSPSLVYELVAVQIHKGNSASHGHYVAHVRDSRRTWWRFDDTEVIKLGNSPAGHTGDHGMGNAAAAAAASPDSPKDIVSANAYMLLYRQRGWDLDRGETEEGQQEAASAAAQESTAGIPPGVLGLVQDCRESFEKECQVYQETKAQAGTETGLKQQFVRELLESAAVTDPANEPCYWISTAWLEEWANCETDCPPIDNARLLCPHGKLEASKLPHMKCLRAEAWLRLKDLCKGGPELTTADVCQSCLDTKVQGAQDAKLAQQVRDELAAKESSKAKDAKEEEEVDPEGYFVSSTWLRGWRRSKALMTAVSPTAAITCPHGQLIPEASSSAAKRTVVAPHIWHVFAQLWRKHQEGKEGSKGPGNDGVGKKGTGKEGGVKEVEDLTSDVSDVEVLPSPSSGPCDPESSPVLLEFPTWSAMECQQCAESLGVAREEQSKAKSVMADARKELANLAAGVPLSLQPGTTYYMVPSDWLAAWRARVNSTKRSSIGAPVTPTPLCPLSEALCPLLCPCHSRPPRLATQLPVLEMSRNNRCCQPKAFSDELTLVSGEDWLLLREFCLLHTNPCRTDAADEEQQSRLEAMEQGVKAWVLVEPTTQNGSSKAEVSEEPSGGKNVRAAADEGASSSKSSAREGTRKAALRTSPELCTEWLAAQDAAKRLAALTYFHREVIVQVATAEELPSLVSVRGERRSKRSRRGRTVLQLDSSCTLQQLKLHIYQHLGIHPANADIYVRGELAQGEDLTLAQLEVFPDEELLLVHAGRTDDDDFVSLVGIGGAAGPAGRAREVEMGFKNTALAETSSDPKPAPDTTQLQERPIDAATPPASPTVHFSCARSSPKANARILDPAETISTIPDGEVCPETSPTHPDSRLPLKGAPVLADIEHCGDGPPRKHQRLWETDDVSPSGPHCSHEMHHLLASPGADLPHQTHDLCAGGAGSAPECTTKPQRTAVDVPHETHNLAMSPGMERRHVATHGGAAPALQHGRPELHNCDNNSNIASPRKSARSKLQNSTAPTGVDRAAADTARHGPPATVDLAEASGREVDNVRMPPACSGATPPTRVGSDTQEQQSEQCDVVGSVSELPASCQPVTVCADAELLEQQRHSATFIEREVLDDPRLPSASGVEVEEVVDFANGAHAVGHPASGVQSAQPSGSTREGVRGRPRKSRPEREPGPPMKRGRWLPPRANGMALHEDRDATSRSVMTWTNGDVAADVLSVPDQDEPSETETAANGAEPNQNDAAGGTDRAGSHRVMHEASRLYVHFECPRSSMAGSTTTMQDDAPSTSNEEAGRNGGGPNDGRLLTYARQATELLVPRRSPTGKARNRLHPLDMPRPSTTTLSAQNVHQPPLASSAHASGGYQL